MLRTGVVVDVVVGVRGKTRMYYSLLAYCTARFGRSNFGHQMSPAPTDAFRTLAAEVGTYGRGIRPEISSTLHLGIFYMPHGVTFLPKEGVLRIFPPLKIRRLRPAR
jgi:hypothetical protein